MPDDVRIMKILIGCVPSWKEYVLPAVLQAASESLCSAAGL